MKRRKLQIAGLPWLSLAVALLFGCFRASAQDYYTPQRIILNRNGTLAPANGSGLVTVAPTETQRKNLEHLKKLATDKTVSDEAVFKECQRLFSSWGEPGLDYVGLDAIEKLLNENREPYMAPLIKGDYFIASAWQWRGNSYADKVTTLQWKMFGSKLEQAQTALEEAWGLDPQRPVIPNLMLIVELGQGKGRDRMELWFQRAMALDKTNYFACCEKLLYLEPKWYGSAPQMLAFGHECLESTNWGGSIPLIMVAAHRANVNYLAVSARAAYWRQPAVWSDVKAAFSKYFQTNPDDSQEHQRYAALAYAAFQWDTLNEQLPLPGQVDYSIFGGKPGYDKMVKMAHDHAGGAN